jgi:hypothetical protein
MDFLQVYDCFTYVVLLQLEALGYQRARRRATTFVKDGQIQLGGRTIRSTPTAACSAKPTSGGSTTCSKRCASFAARLPASGRCEGAQTGLVTGWGDLGDGSLAILRRFG